jgi:hypothetical protein
MEMFLNLSVSVSLLRARAQKPSAFQDSGHRSGFGSDSVLPYLDEYRAQQNPEGPDLRLMNQANETFTAWAAVTREIKKLEIDFDISAAEQGSRTSESFELQSLRLESERLAYAAQHVLLRIKTGCRQTDGLRRGQP